jgi:hypothetical protein
MCARDLLRATGAFVATAAIGAGPSAQAPMPLGDVLARVAARVEQYYKRVENIICSERVTAQQVDSRMSPEGFARVLEYELRVERDDAADADGSADAKFVRELKKVNGRVPRANDKPGCFDPNPLTLDPLAFLLPAHRDEYAFSLAGNGKGKDANALIVEYRPREKGKPEIVEDAKKRDDCFSISLPGATRGRVWIDLATFDVLRVEEHLASRVDVRVPFQMQTKRGLPDSLVVERYDSQIRYKPVAFKDPDETILLPESITVLAIMHGAGSHRTQQEFSDYRRFLTRGRLVK